jgi:hypothetical protein
MRLSSLLASLTIVAVVLLLTQSVMASAYLFSGFGSGFTCTPTAPCTFTEALTEESPPGGLEIGCADSSENEPATITRDVTINCAGTNGSIGAVTIASGATVVLRNLTIARNNITITLQSGTLIMENVYISGAVQNAILAQPNSASTLVLKNCLIDGSASGILLKPAAGGSINATLDHVTISGNTGGGLKIDTTNGPVSLDITDSVVSNNSGNGINAVGGAGGHAMVSIKNSVIAKNGTAGVQANGANAGVLVQTTLFDQNADGATSVVAGGHISTYGNNSIVGSSGSGFTGTASLQ